MAERSRFSLVFAAIIASTLGNRAVADSPTVNASLSSRLEHPVTASWSNLPFREAMASLAKAQQIAILIDRRVDGDAVFSLSLTADPLGVALQKIAERKNIGVSTLGSIVYFGPQTSTEKLKTLAALRRDEIAGLPAGARRLMLQSRSWSWEDLAEPRTLLGDLAKEARVQLEVPQKLPHDLWRGNRLPAAIWSDRLSLLLIQFDMTFTVGPDGRSISIAPIPDVVQIERSYAGGDDPESRARKLAARVPGARIRVDTNKLQATGRIEDHEQIAQLLSGRSVRTTTVKPGRDVYTLKVEGLPLEKVFMQLGTMLKLNIRYDEKAIDKAGISLAQLITFRVENATLDELLTAALKDTELTYERKDDSVTIKPR